MGYRTELAGCGEFAYFPYEQWDITPVFPGEVVINPFDCRVFFVKTSKEHKGYKYSNSVMELDEYADLLRRYIYLDFEAYWAYAK